MRTYILLIGLMVACRATGHAAEATVYDLATCIRAALQHSPDLAAAAADLAGARAQLAEAKAGRYGRGEYRQYVGLVNEAKGDVINSPNSKNDLLSGLGPFVRLEVDISIPLWTFGKLDAALKAAQEGLNSRRAQKEVTRAQVVLQTEQMYYGLLLSRQLSGVLHDMLETMDKAVKKTQERLDSGSTAVTELDLLKLKVGRARFAKGVLEVDTSLDLTRSALARAIGIDAPEHFDIADRKLRPVEATIAPLETYLTDAPARRPEVRALMTGLAAQAAKLDLEEAGYYPTVFLATGVQFARAPNRTEQDNPFAYDDFNFIRPIGVLGMHWDLNFFTTNAKVAQARADLDRLVAQQRDATSGLQLEIRRAYADVVQSRDTITTAEEGRKAGRGLLILSVANFDLGIGEAEELFKALGAYTESSTDYFRAVHDYNMAVATLGKAVGTELTALAY